MAMDLSGYVRKRTTIKIGNTEFVFTELSLADLAAFKAHLMEQRKKINYERRERLLTDAERIGNIEPTELLKFLDSSISEEELEAQMESVEGLGYLAYLSLKYHYPEVSKEDALKVVTPEFVEPVTLAMFPLEPEKDLKKKKEQKKTPKKSQKPQQ